MTDPITTAALLPCPFCGKTDEEISAITGHKSVAMVRKYAGAARQKARARKAQEGRK